jgi:hypothetical protein
VALIAGRPHFDKIWFDEPDELGSADWATILTAHELSDHLRIAT